MTYAQRLGSNLTGSARQLASDQAGQSYQSIVDRYELYERYYDNEMYAIARGGIEAIKRATGLYRNIRAIHNPIRRAVDWYPGHVYPGAMTPDGLPMPDGTPCCVPFAADTDEALRLAMIQGLVWANWGSNKTAVIRSLATLGDAFAEIEVDFERNKVYPKFVHPKHVTNLEWNGSGDITLYRLDIPEFDEARQRKYKYSKIVDRETITTLYDDKLHSYVDGQPPIIPNEWGFVPAAWAQFRNVGGQHGASMIDGVRGKIDSLNSSVSSIHDYIGKFVAQGILISADGGLKAFEAANTSATARTATAELTNPESGRQELRYIFAPVGTATTKLIENLGLAEAVPHIQSLINEIEADLPEPTIDDRIQQMGTPPSGVALKRMFSGVTGRLDEVCGNADHMLVKLMQMATSIGGELANSGAWGLRSQLSEQQQRFLPFDLSSYDDGDLSVTILPRPLFPDSQQDRIQTAMQIESLRTPTGMRLAGLDQDVIDALVVEQQNSSANSADVLGRAFSSGRGF